MASDLSLTPIFFEALAAVAVCSPADAAEHFASDSRGKEHPVEAFLDEYVAHA